MTQANGMRLNAWHLFGIIEEKSSLCTGVVKLTGNMSGGTGGHLTTSLLENDTNTKGNRLETQSENKYLGPPMSTWIQPGRKPLPHCVSQ